MSCFFQLPPLSTFPVEKRYNNSFSNIGEIFLPGSKYDVGPNGRIYGYEKREDWILTPRIAHSVRVILAISQEDTNEKKQLMCLRMRIIRKETEYGTGDGFHVQKGKKATTILAQHIC